MIKVRVPAQPIEAARLCMGVKDVRYYLNGIRINKDRISGTDGHTLYDHQFLEPLDIEGDYILTPTKAVPPSADYADIEISEGLAIIKYFKHGTDKIIGIDAAELIDGKYPDVDKPMKCTKEKPAAVPAIMFNAGYLAKVEKIAKRIAGKYAGAKMVFHGDSNEPGHFEFDSPEGKHFYIVMPMRM